MPSPGLGHADDSVVRPGVVLSGAGDKMRYTYAFGDDWEDDIQPEEILSEEPGSSYPFCLAGKGACPPEDCGGRWGYAGLQDILAGPGAEGHQGSVGWLGPRWGDGLGPQVVSRGSRETMRSQPTTAR